MSETTSARAQRKLPLAARVIALIAMPLFFLVTFSLTYVSAMHAPTPHDLALTLAGPDTVTAQVATQIEDTAEGAFEITRTPSLEEGADRVKSRDALGAILIDDTHVTTVIASGGGRVATNVIQTMGDQVAAGLEGTNTVQDLAPVSSGDVTGTTPFYFLVVCTVGAFLAIVGISQAVARPSMRFMLTTNVIAAIVIPIVGFTMMSFFVGDYDTSFGDISAVVGIGMLYALTVGLITTLLTRLLGAGAIFVVIVFLVGLNFPSSGGSIPGAMLPPFWQGIHHFWIGSGAMEAIRSILYFNGAQAGLWIAQLLVWFVLAVILTALVGIATRNRERPAPLTSRTGGPVSRASELAGEAAAGAAIP